MRKKKSAKEVFDAPVFTDVAYAQTVYDESMHKLDMWKIGLIVSIASPFIGLGLWMLLNHGLSNDGSVWLMFFMLAIPAFTSYALAGGFRFFFSIFGRVAKFGWFVIPYFPMDVIVELCILVIGFFIMIYLPVIFVLLARWQLVKDRNAAESYLRNVLTSFQE